MLNRRGLDSSNYGIIAILVILLIVTIAVVGYSSEAKQVYKNRMGEPSVSFGTAWKNDGFKFLDYIFGKIPSFLAEWRGDDSGMKIGASIITIAIWFLFLLVFGDIMTTFGFFSKTVGWLIGAILTVVAANIQLLKFVSIVGLSVTAIFGTASVLLGIAWIFVMFVLFHFGSSGLRRWVVLRREQDEGLNALRGAMRAGAGIEAAAAVGAAAKKAAKGS